MPLSAVGAGRARRLRGIWSFHPNVVPLHGRRELPSDGRPLTCPLAPRTRSYDVLAGKRANPTSIAAAEGPLSTVIGEKGKELKTPRAAIPM